MASLAWALGTVLHRRLPLPASSAISAAAQMLVGGFLLLLAAAALGELAHPSTLHPAPAGLAALAYLVLAGSVLGYSYYVWLLRHVAASRVASYALVNPVVALAAGYLWAGERLTPYSAAGAALILLALALVLARPRRQLAGALSRAGAPCRESKPWR